MPIILLALDTSGPACSAAVTRDGALLAEVFAQNGATHSENLMPMAEQALAYARVGLGDITALAVVNGPGSFTGVRIGVSAARALSLALGVGVVAVDALEALAQAEFDGAICPLLDARRAQVYAAAFINGKRVLRDRAQDIGGFLDEAQGLAPRLMFVGDGSLVNAQSIRARLGQRAVIRGHDVWQLRASQAAGLAYSRLDKAVPGVRIEPYYLRAPQAEREYDAKAAKGPNNG